jgi:hypothetical protein
VMTRSNSCGLVRMISNASAGRVVV